jgi:hypothetical protein
MAVDQRYCLQCGQRRGDPRLPFMDAVTFMDAAKRPPQAATPAPPSRRKPRMTANASLIAGVGTLLLAMGIGVLIGKTGEGSSSAGTGAPQIVKIGGGGEVGGTATGSGASSGKTGATTGGKGATSKAKSKEKLSADSSGTTKAAAEILKPAGDVKLPPPTVQKGGKCESGAAGCEGGEFTGNFFGE